MLRMLISAFILCLLSFSLSGQRDTTIYKVVEEMPRFPTACEALDTTMAFKQRCATQAMLDYVYRRIQYPREAIEQNIQGTAVVTFVVEADGTVSQPKVVRDLGGGTGVAAIGVVLQMMEEKLRWVPGRQRGKDVRVQFNLPVKFKIRDPDPFVLAGRDTVYTQFDQEIIFEGGTAALQTYLDESLDYPAAGNDSCSMGQIDVQVLIEGDGDVRILDITDYNELGFDFWYAAIDVATSTYGRWEPARYQDRPVNAAFDLSLSFLPTIESCQTEVDRFLAGRKLAEEGAELFNSGEVEIGLAKMTEAAEAFPNDAQIRMLRGQAYLNNNQLAEACEDLSAARRIALVNWYDSVLNIICK